jgi:hypothetical protein
MAMPASELVWMAAGDGCAIALDGARIVARSLPVPISVHSSVWPDPAWQAALRAGALNLNEPEYGRNLEHLVQHPEWRPAFESLPQAQGGR